VKSLIHCATESDPLDMTDLTTTEMPTKPKKTGVMSLPWELIASLIGVVSGLSLFEPVPKLWTPKNEPVPKLWTPKKSISGLFAQRD
jgi:hypothetical protein